MMFEVGYYPLFDDGQSSYTEFALVDGSPRQVTTDFRFEWFIHAVPLTAPGKRDWLSKRTVKTDASGRYRFERLAAGRYELLAGEHLVVTVTVVDRGEQKLDLEKPAPVDGRR